MTALLAWSLGALFTGLALILAAILLNPPTLPNPTKG